MHIFVYSLARIRNKQNLYRASLVKNNSTVIFLEKKFELLSFFSNIPNCFICSVNSWCEINFFSGFSLNLDFFSIWKRICIFFCDFLLSRAWNRNHFFSLLFLENLFTTTLRDIQSFSLSFSDCLRRILTQTFALKKDFALANKRLVHT